MAGPQDGAQLRLEELRIGTAEADAAKTHERIGLIAMAQVGNVLVAAEVERADGHLLIRRGFDDGAVGGQLLLLVGHRGMRQEQVFGAIQPDAGGAGGAGRRRVGGTVDVGQQLQTDAVGGDRLLIAVLDQPAGEVGVLALQLAIGRLHLRTGIEINVSLAAIDGDQVAGVHLAQQAAQSGDGGNAEGAGEDGGVAGGAARFGDDAGDQMAVERQRLRRQNLLGDEDDRLMRIELGKMVFAVQLRENAADHVAEVGHALLQIRVGDLAEQLVIFVENLAQGGRGVDVAFENGGSDARAERRIAQQQAMGAKDGGLILANLLADALDGGVQFAGDRSAGVIETTDLAGQRGSVQMEGFLLEQSMVHAKSAGHSHPWRYGQAAFHDRRS